MTDEVPTTLTNEKKDERRPTPTGNRGQSRRTPSAQRSASAMGNSGPNRPSSRSSNKKTGPASATPPAESGSDTAKRGGETKKNDSRNRNQGGGRNRKAPASAASARPENVTHAEASALPGSVAASGNDGSDALSNLQRMITDLKTMPPQTLSQGAPTVTSNQGGHYSLPPTAPVFQPGAAAYPGLNTSNDAPRHRKAVSLGVQPNAMSHYASSMQFSSNLGGLMEDTLEEGELNDQPISQQPGHRVTQSQSFTAPRFAALSQQNTTDQQQASMGRPQLAPGFTFGARRRGSSSVNIPAIGEEDIGFQFPQQSMQSSLSMDNELANQRNTQLGGEISGIMAEQIALQSQIEALQRQQAELYQQQIASNPVMATVGNPVPGRGAHRRVQSVAPSPMTSSFNFGQGGMGALGSQSMGMGLDAQGAPRGHGRRHSVNVVKPVGSLGGGGGFDIPQEGFDDGFAPPPPGGHSRTASRVDPNWRNTAAGGMQGTGASTADLAQAQAHLQSLQQFRAASGGHHQKMASFSFPNMLPNLLAANMVGLGGFNLLQQQQQQFQMQLQQQSNQPQRKSLFAPYLPQASLPPLLAAGKLVVGILRVNKRNRSDAYISTEVLDSDIYICGSKDRNRALEGDIVAVELLDVDDVWGAKKEKEEKKRKKEENAAYDVRATTARKNDKKKDDVEVEGQGLTLFEDEEVTDEVKPQFAGHVVAVVERMPGQLFSGTLGLLRPSSAATKEKQEAERREREGDAGQDSRPSGPIERPKIVWFKPTDKRVPLIAIPTEQAPPDFVQNSEAYSDKLFVACIKRHPISSLHPFGTLVEELGPIGDIEVETSALLKDCNFPSEEFNDNVLKCVPPVPWTIPEREYEVRKDFREELVFTIDPASAKDLDDALSVHVNDDGTYDVGVHIADVSYFVKHNTALDRDARKKATSVYLVQRAVPMLPQLLCEELCSLNPKVERLAFSIVFTMTEDARVLKKWFGKSIIRSAAKLSYSDAQTVLDGKPLVGVEVMQPFAAGEVEQKIKALQSLAVHLRDRRFQIGSLALRGSRLSFTLGDDSIPSDCYLDEKTDANGLIEEFMLLTNTTVAQQIAVHLPEQALLRRHESPIERRLNAFKQRASKLGFSIDVSSAGALMRSFQAVQNPVHIRVLQLLCHKALHRAKYFCAGMLDIAKYGHYALNSPLYTHFTSPIRRYADIIVHRQLESILTESNGDAKFAMDRETVAKIAQTCNIKKDSAKLAQEQSTHLYLCVLIHDLTQRHGPVVRQATVVNVLDSAFDVLVPEFGIEKRVHVDQMPIENNVYDEHAHTLQIYWSTRDVISWLAETSDDEHLKKVKQTAEQHALKMEITSRSVLDESALFDDDGEDEIVMERTRSADDPKEASKQRQLSKQKAAPKFEGLRSTAAGHKIQDIKELMTVPVIITADLTKSPPVIKVYSVNPYTDSATK